MKHQEKDHPSSSETEKKPSDFDFSSLGCIGILLFFGVLAEIFPWNNGLWPLGIPFLGMFLVYVYLGLGFGKGEGGFGFVWSVASAIYCGLGFLGLALLFFGLI